jgi:hypothetical protein
LNMMMRTIPSKRSIHSFSLEDRPSSLEYDVDDGPPLYQR